MALVTFDYGVEGPGLVVGSIRSLLSVIQVVTLGKMLISLLVKNPRETDGGQAG